MLLGACSLLSNPTAEEAYLRRFLPYVMCSSFPKAILGQKVSGVALVARRPLQDEELLLNYRLNPMLPLPEWYHPVDTLADERRWT